ncbi:hypothetical protein GCM10007424_21310 [Flavobacterium suaedae]|uniref:DNA topoisomerase IV n=1 Tax=Flavobacterium suaedae TaxID=1767027 RepID=A0ABQ1K299_9FLAO|nr:hypothetical protein [Flavobacterium suaedae]GGB80942.1 hypothetical protein GCM10007424_21310 [Flavobacterium suaedae]
MKLYLNILLLVLLPITGYGQNSCEKFKEGKFKFTDPNSQKVIIITRKGDVQTEKILDSDEIYDFNLKWIDSCTYTISPTPATIKRKKEVAELGTMTVKITPASDSSYVQVARVANSPKFKRRDEVFIIEE